MSGKSATTVKTETKPQVLGGDRSHLLQHKPELGNSVGLMGERGDFSPPVTETSGSSEPGIFAPVLHELIQPKLTVGVPNDKYEQEADRVANQIVQMPNPTKDANQIHAISKPSIQRICTECDEKPKQPNEDEKKKNRFQMQPLASVITPVLQRQAEFPKKGDEEKKKFLQKKASSKSSSDVAPSLQKHIGTLQQGGGESLSASERSFFEPRFGHDFSQVKIHQGTLASEVNNAINARAFTIGQDVVFGSGQYQPSTSEGKRLLAHELTHVVQQSGQFFPSTTNFSKSETSNLGDSDSPAVQSINTFAEAKPAVLQQSPKTIMREALFSSTMEICHRLLRSRVFHVSQGGLAVTADAGWNSSPEWQGTDAPVCGKKSYSITLNQKGLIYDSEYGSCEFEMGSPASRIWTNLPEDDYYLDIWTNNTNPNCCLSGEIEVSQQSGLEGESCTELPLSTMDFVHGALDIAGFVPVLGAIPDGINAGIYAVEGDWVNAGLSAVAMIPAWGDGVKLGEIGTKSAIKISRKAALRLGKEGIAKGLKEVRAASKAEKATLEAAELGSKALAKDTAKVLLQIFRKGEKFKSVGAVSLNRLRNVLGRAGVSPRGYKLVKVSQDVSKAMEKEAGTEIWGWVTRAGGEVVKDAKGRPIINFTSRGLSSLEEAVKTFGHEAKHLKDFASGMVESSEVLAEKAGEKLWMIVQKSLE
jgi:Domain of unknown function (DUF4157)